MIYKADTSSPERRRGVCVKTVNYADAARSVPAMWLVNKLYVS